jgi:hypothetical protein
VCKLAFGDTIAEEQDTFWLRFGLLIECLLSDWDGKLGTLNNSTVIASRSEMISTRGPWARKEAE